jgi:molybdopterin-guanine dinucleotide biosynthesis protein A
MNIIIPLGGKGERFAKNGYAQPKPLIQYVLDNLKLTDEDRVFIMEVKNVPLADYEDITAKDRKGKCYDDRPLNSKVAYFPDGYRKKAPTLSARAT